MMDDPTAGAENQRVDYFSASLEEGSLVMEPHCSCGETLGEEYFCEACQRQCLCLEIRCDTEETLKHVQGFIQTHPTFKNFRAVLLEKSEGTKT